MSEPFFYPFNVLSSCCGASLGCVAGLLQGGTAGWAGQRTNGQTDAPGVPHTPLAQTFLVWCLPRVSTAPGGGCWVGGAPVMLPVPLWGSPGGCQGHRPHPPRLCSAPRWLAFLPPLCPESVINIPFIVYVFHLFFIFHLLFLLHVYTSRCLVYLFPITPSIQTLPATNRGSCYNNNNNNNKL